MGLFSRGGPFRTSGLGMHWDTEDPFIFASHHEDDYPNGNRQQAPPLEQISGRNLGRDYKKILGFRMYHGKVVPGFPMHAHWGYETLTVPELGFVDHFDTEGVDGRFGFGDCQWVSASSKYEHCEMYPLVEQEARNPNDITQIMINLPLESKNMGCSVSTIWKEDKSVVSGDGWTIELFCGRFGGSEAESPNDVSYARSANRVRIMRIVLEPGASISLDGTDEKASRNLYYVSGEDSRGELHPPQVLPQGLVRDLQRERDVGHVAPGRASDRAAHVLVRTGRPGKRSRGQEGHGRDTQERVRRMALEHNRQGASPRDWKIHKVSRRKDRPPSVGTVRGRPRKRAQRSPLK